MKPIILLAFGIIATWSSVSADESSFGNAPRNESAIALGEQVVATYRRDGVEKAIDFLEAEAPGFFEKSGATARYDFLAALFEEAMGPRGLGHEDAEWKQALIRWSYQYCRNQGRSYWYERWVTLMHEVCFEAGNYGEARAVIDYERHRQIEKGVALDVSKMSSGGPVDPAFPPVTKRKLGPNQRVMIKNFRFLLAESGQDLVEGKWRSGMEGAALAAERAMMTFKWHQQRSELTDSALVMTDVTGHWRKAKWLTAEGYRFLDLPRLELQTCRALSRFNLEEGRGLYDVRMAEARALHLEFILGTNREKVPGALGEIRELFLSEDYSAPLYADRVALMMADVHFLNGQAEKGWEILESLRRKEGHSADMRFYVDREWCRHRVSVGLTDGVESELVDLLRTAREGGLKQREIELYEIYARLLLALGRYEDALVIQRELIRLLESFDVFTRLPGALRTLAEIHARIGQRNRAKADLAEARELLESERMPDEVKKGLGPVLDAPLPDAGSSLPEETVLADLQPLRSVMVPLKGLPARGLFTLSNPSGGEVSGSLQFRGKGLGFGEEVPFGVRVDVAKDGGADELKRDVTVEAGDFYSIDLAAAAGTDAAAVEIIWTPDEGQAQVAQWESGPAESGVSIAVTDASEYLENPFYLIPFYHLLQYRDSFARVADLRVVASSPSRVELYDSNDELVFVDVEGDGSFGSPGDIISKDFNRNGSGDIKLDPKNQEVRFRLLVCPVEKPDGGELKLDVQMFDRGEWVTHATDRLLFESGEE
ncbi:MAG: hypothetical protein MUF31_01005 [Akkermansiaceae bacterium]|jgi:tetratricopeptide (TPR) repeat protein|nr:hypothetical protein [Akkermansiaceae bacterium]